MKKVKADDHAHALDQLVKEYGFRADESLEALHERGLGIVRKQNLPQARAYILHYGFEGKKPHTDVAIAKELGVAYGRVHGMHRATVARLAQILENSRREKSLPADHRTWALADFFTVERGIRVGLEVVLMTTIRAVLPVEEKHTPTVGDLCHCTPRYFKHRGRTRLNTETIKGIQKMLEMEGLSLSSD